MATRTIWSNFTKFLKNLHTEQIAKLHAKNQHECDLLEDLRTYTIKRSAIEKSYSEVIRTEMDNLLLEKEL
ncbi:unnamed protein product [Arctia plantaginis]|uniref:FCH domain-containing protein n=1 Tax=Arctia plantaginis TaxID=874455 RepID=A0A8S0Z0U7_ARCPL|nr:unnamed protein product [Arctia plantaginis]